jgi:RimJ/RimL family protein N-acetyltransferase
MTEAVFPIIDYAFDILGFERLFSSHALGDEKSRRVKEKTGARFCEQNRPNLLILHIRSAKSGN